MIDVGDAVLKFIGDSTQLDSQFDQVGPKAQAAFEPAAEAAEEAGERMTHSMAEARGEVALLGEEFGIRLPRHVRSFVAELPGVGEALTAAFSATAVLFLVQALAEGAEKLSKWIADVFIFTDAMKESNAEIEAQNKTLEFLSKQYEDAKNKLEALNGVTHDAEQAQIDLTKATVDQAKAELEQLKVRLANKSRWDETKGTFKDVANGIIGQLVPSYEFLTQAEKDHAAIQEKENSLTTITAKEQKALAEELKVQAEDKRQSGIKSQLSELDNQRKVALAVAQTEQEKYEITIAFAEKRLALLRSIGATELAQQKALLADIEAEQIKHEQKITAAFINLLETVKAARASALDAMTVSRS